MPEVSVPIRAMGTGQVHAGKAGVEVRLLLEMMARIHPQAQETDS